MAMQFFLVNHASVKVLRGRIREKSPLLFKAEHEVCWTVWYAPKSLIARGSTLAVLLPGRVVSFREICLLSLGSVVFRGQ